MVKKLLAAGCSYTEDYYDFPVWPTILADKLNMECINVGKCGAGNEYIYGKTLDTLVTDKNIGLVVVMWSEFERGSHAQQAFLYQRKNEKKVLSAAGQTLWKFLEIDTIEYMTDNSIRFLYSLQQLMKLEEYNNIPFFQLIGTYPANDGGHRNWPSLAKSIRPDNRARSIKTIIKSPYLNKIDETSFLGWPIFDELGGWNIDTWLQNQSPQPDQDFRISKDDNHPNKKGHEIIAEMLYNKIKKSM